MVPNIVRVLLKTLHREFAVCKDKDLAHWARHIPRKRNELDENTRAILAVVNGDFRMASCPGLRDALKVASRNWPRFSIGGILRPYVHRLLNYLLSFDLSGQGLRQHLLRWTERNTASASYAAVSDEMRR